MTLFDQLLDRLKKKHPSHGIIPVIEELGDTALARMYIDFAMEETSAAPPPEVQIKSFYRQKDKLYNQRAILSNKFHECKTDKDRREISIAIGSIQTAVIDNRRVLEHYDNTGSLPAAPERLMPLMDGRRKEKKLHSVRSSISRFRGLMQKEKDEEKIKTYERRINQLEALARELSA